MKKMTLSLAMFSSLLCAMNENATSSQISDLSQASSSKDVFNILVAQRSGRDYLLHIRTGEIAKEEGVSQMIGSKYLATSSLYTNSQQLIYYKPTKQTLYSQMHKLHILVRGMAHIEQFLLQESPSETITKALEETRMGDSVLLCKILKEDIEASDGIDRYKLPEILEDTHADWPPKKFTHCVDSRSGYTMIKAALAARKAAHSNENEKQ